MNTTKHFIYFLLALILTGNNLYASEPTGADRGDGANPDQNVAASFLPFSNRASLQSHNADTSLALLDKPAIPLMGIVWFKGKGKEKTTIKEEDVQTMLDMYVGLHVPESDATLNNSGQWNAMTEAKPGYMILPYFASTVSKPSMGITRALEEDPLSLCSMYLEGHLKDSIGPTTITFSYSPAMQTGCGLKASKTSGDLSQNISTYIIFIRIDDEIMKVLEIDTASCELTVIRGYKNTDAASHSKNARVMGPVYRGKRDVTNPGTYGVSSCFPDHSDFGQNSLPQYHLRMDNKKTATLIAQASEKYFDSGLNGLWLDLTSSGIFIPCNAYGITVKPWNFELEKPYTSKSYLGHQELKIHNMREEIKKMTGFRPYLVSNNHANGKYFEGNGMDLVRPTEQKPDPIEGVILEAAFCFYQINKWFPIDHWKTNLSTLIHGAQNKYPVLPWIKSMRYAYLPKPKNSEADRFQFFDYTSTLLGYEPDAGIFCPIPAYEIDEDDNKTLNLPDYLFYDIGQPLERVNYNKVSDLIIPGTNTYRRQWSKAMVYVNPTYEDDDNIDVPAGYIDPETGNIVNSISMPAHTGKILLSTINIEVDSLSLNDCPFDGMVEGDRHQLSAMIYPIDATNKIIDWISSDPSILSVDNAGRLIAITPGKATVTATSYDGGYTDECVIEVLKAPVSVTSVSISDCPFGINQAGDSFQLLATVSPDDAADKSVTWSSSNTSVATVDETGLVTAHAMGNAFIRVTTNDIGFYDECIVLVDDSGTTDATQIENHSGDARIYPNPVSDNLYFKFSDSDRYREIIIFDSTGQIICKEPASELIKIIDIKKLGVNGFLAVQVNSEKHSFVHKICAL